MTDFHGMARPWAAIKHGLLQYVELFLGKLGRTGKNIYYVDGFAGPGRLKDGTEGSPLKVARIAQNPRQSSRRGMLKCINCEKELREFAELEIATDEFKKEGIVENLLGEFDVNLPKILSLVSDSPVLFFIDPFGTQGAELSTLQTIAQGPRGREVLVRFDDTRVKRLIRFAANNISNLNAKQQRIAAALADRVKEFTTPSDVEAILALLDQRECGESRAVLVEAYCNIVLDQTAFKHALSYPLRNPKTGGHRYFIVHFCSHRDGYVHMADFMAKAERAYLRLQSELRLDSPGQMEFPTIKNAIDDAVHGDKQALVLSELPAIIEEKRWRGSSLECRRVFESIVDHFGWEVLRREYLTALRQFKKDGRANFTDLEDKSIIEFSR